VVLQAQEVSFYLGRDEDLVGTEALCVHDEIFDIDANGGDGCKVWVGLSFQQGKREVVRNGEQVQSSVTRA